MLRIDRKVLKPQVLVLAHVRELAQQIADVYSALTKNTDIQVSNFTVTGKADGHIVVSTIGKILNDFKSRKPLLDLSALQCIVIDEADFFFSKKEEIDAIREIDAKHIKKIPHKVQYILFSATYPEAVKEAIG